MAVLDAVTKDAETITHCKDGHALRVFRNANGGYHVTCMDCDWWTSVPAGERLKGWDQKSYYWNKSARAPE